MSRFEWNPEDEESFSRAIASYPVLKYAQCIGNVNSIFKKAIKDGMDSIDASKDAIIDDLNVSVHFHFEIVNLESKITKPNYSNDPTAFPRYLATMLASLFESLESMLTEGWKEVTIIKSIVVGNCYVAFTVAVRKRVKIKKEKEANTVGMENRGRKLDS